LPTSNTSRWISPHPTEGGGELAGSYTYRTTFDLSSFDPSTARLTVKVAIDDKLTDIKLNGQSSGLTASGYAAFTTLTIDHGFAFTLNTLEFVISNAPAAGANPSGLRVELSIMAAPLPTDLPPWRASEQARRAWQDKLKARIAQGQALTQGLQAAVGAAESATLPDLRDALINAIADGRPTTEISNWLTAALLIDVKASGLQKTTRMG